MTTTPPLDEEEPYRDDVRVLLEAEGWRETAEDCVVADNGALWTETNLALDSGVDAPDKSWSVSFDNNVPACVIAAVAVVASGTDLLAEVRRLRTRVAELERPSVEAKRNEIRQSYTDLIVQVEQDRDFEGAFDVQCRLREREEQWKAEDAARPAAVAAAGNTDEANA